VRKTGVGRDVRCLYSVRTCVAQARDADEIAVTGRSDSDEPTSSSSGNVEDLVHVELYCCHGGLFLYRSGAGISLSWPVGRQIMLPSLSNASSSS
jgi:hypothetical protein